MNSLLYLKLAYASDYERFLHAKEFCSLYVLVFTDNIVKGITYDYISTNEYTIAQINGSEIHFRVMDIVVKLRFHYKSQTFSLLPESKSNLKARCA